MKLYSLASYLFVALLSLAVAEPGSAQGNLDVQRSAEWTASTVDPATAAALEAEALLGGTSPLVVPGADFADDGLRPDTSFFSFSGGYLAGNAEAYGCSMAPVYLPSGSTVTDLFVTVADDDAASDIEVSLRKVDSFTGTAVQMASAMSSGTSGTHTILDSTITDPTVFQPDDNVYLTTCVLSSSLRIISARVYFTN